MLATISRRIRRAFGRPGDEPAPELLFRLQAHLSATCGGAVMGCRCGGYITPIVNRYPTHTAVVALGCLSCHSVAPLEESGVLESAPESEGVAPRPSPAGATVH